MTNKKCKHKTTEAFSDPLNSYFGVSYRCKNCGEIIDLEEIENLSEEIDHD